MTNYNDLISELEEMGELYQGNNLTYWESIYVPKAALAIRELQEDLGNPRLLHKQSCECRDLELQVCEQEVAKLEAKLKMYDGIFINGGDCETNELCISSDRDIVNGVTIGMKLSDWITQLVTLKEGKHE
jgi:peptidase E